MSGDAVLVGDPGRALLLAQELLLAPKMSNHARGLWGYTGATPGGGDLTIQATGMGGPSAAIVLAELAELGVRRAIRVGTCAALVPSLKPGDLLVVEEAASSAGGFRPDRALTANLRGQLSSSAFAKILSRDDPARRSTPFPGGLSGADLQTATVFARSSSLGIATAAVLIVEEGTDGAQILDPELEQAAKRAGAAAAAALST